MKEERIVYWAIKISLMVIDGKPIVNTLKELIKEVERDDIKYYLTTLTRHNNCEKK